MRRGPDEQARSVFVRLPMTAWPLSCAAIADHNEVRWKGAAGRAKADEPYNPPLRRQPSSVDDNLLTCHVRGRIRKQEHRCAAQFLR